MANMVEPPLGTPFQIMKKVKMAYCQFQDTDDVEEKIILFFFGGEVKRIRHSRVSKKVGAKSVSLGMWLTI